MSSSDTLPYGPALVRFADSADAEANAWHVNY